tara:strand:+ start:224 stop:934 length:711 start_codon:yes stop_codon:yes gene_type:complete
MNHIPFKNYQRANEILYILYSSDLEGNNYGLSKIAIQKIIYLANLYSPLKEIILSTIRFMSYKRGPYSPDIQNSLDQLMSNGYVNISDYQSFSNNASNAEYKISEAGVSVVNNLICLDKEEEKKWWYSVIFRLSRIYSEQITLKNQNGEYSGFDKIVNLVYKDSTFLQYKKKQHNAFIDLENKSLPTYELIALIKDYVKMGYIELNQENERNNTEFILIGFYEFLYSQFLDQSANG